MRDVFSFEERDRIIRQQQIIDELGKDFIAKKRKELCDNCNFQYKCRLIPDRDGCCYHEPIRTIIVDAPLVHGDQSFHVTIDDEILPCRQVNGKVYIEHEPLNIEDAPFLVEIDEMIQRGTISAIIEPEDPEDVEPEPLEIEERDPDWEEFIRED